MTTYWEDALADLVSDLDEHYELDEFSYHDTASCLQNVGYVIDKLNQHVASAGVMGEATLAVFWRLLARLALSRLVIEWGVSEREALETVAQLVISKQHDYGHGNISKFGSTGIIVRTNDKFERLLNLVGKDTPSNEALEDTWADLVGYSLIGLMWLDGTFQLDLRPAGLDHEIQQGYGDVQAGPWLGTIEGPE